MSNIQKAQSSIELARPDFERNVETMNLDLNFQKEASFALQMFQANDYLAGMDPASIKNAIVNVSLTGLTLNPVMKMAYLVPRKGKCVLDVSYMGLIKIVTDTGSVKNIEAKIVYSNEPFEIQQGTDGYVKHSIAPTKDKGHMIGVYSIAKLNDGSTSIEWMYKSDVDEIMQRSEAVKADKMSPWKTDYPQMARKTVVKRHYKFLPKSERGILVANAIATDNENNGIDFEKENQKNKSKTVAIDMFDNSVEDNVKAFTELIELAKDGTIPNVFKTKTGEYNMVATIESLEADFSENNLHLEKFTKMNDFIRKTHAFFVSYNKKKDDES